MKYQIENPILPGFHPDPSAIRVGSTYYVAVSTFEWFPGVDIYRSENLRDWQWVACPLSRTSQLDMRGVEASGGVWAPNLSYAEGVFYLVYTDMKNGRYAAKDLDNYLVTSLAIDGPWSEPIFLNSTGFDPALFHDEDGEKYLINLRWDFRPGKNRFGGIELQEYDPIAEQLVGPIHLISPPKGLREGSNLYKIDGYYYLMLAEGGTGIEHATVLSRSNHILGPYVDDPTLFLMTSRFDPFHPIQRAGHASLIETPDGQWYLLHLAGRLLPSSGRGPLGRECFLQKLVRDEEGWFRLIDGGILPSTHVPAPVALPDTKRDDRWFDDFDVPTLQPEWKTLREPIHESRIDLVSRPGYLRLKGRRSLFSSYAQALIARRWTDHVFTATTVVAYQSDDYHRMAGMVALYDQENWYYLGLTWDEHMGTCLKLMTADNGTYSELAIVPYIADRVYIRLSVMTNKLAWFYACTEEKEYVQIGPLCDASRLSDEYCRVGRFTGAMVGLCCQDLTGFGHAADFDWFEYCSIRGKYA